MILKCFFFKLKKIILIYFQLKNIFVKVSRTPHNQSYTTVPFVVVILKNRLKNLF